MVLKQRKRSLENGKSSQPTKYHNHLDYNRGHAAAVAERVSIKSPQKSCFPVYGRQPGNLHNFCGDEPFSSSRFTNHCKFDACYDDTYLPEQEEGDEKSIEIENEEENASAKDTIPASIATHNDIVGRCWRRFAATTETELVNSQNSVHKFNKEHFCSQCSIAVKEVAEAKVMNAALDESVLSQNGCQTHQEIVSDVQQIKDMETCTSVSSVDNSSRSRVSKDLDLDLVSATSPSSDNMMCDSETLNIGCKGLVNVQEHSLPPPPVRERGLSRFTAYPEVDCGGDQHFSHSESSTGLDGFPVEHVPFKRVPIGPEFQAEIPIWRPQSKAYPPVGYDEKQAWQTVHRNDDEKQGHGLVGHREWPLLGSDGGFKKDVIGQGRSGDCSCPDQGSIRCVKEHIGAEREKLKLKLGEAFYLWRFDDMGETVSDKWTREEEHTFWELVNINPISSNKNFWDYLAVAFPSRSKKELVSYYFNVFVLRRRALQNRLDPDNIDSDDDETDWQDSEIEASCRLMTEEEDDSGADSDATEYDDEVAESDATGDDDEVADATEDDEVVTSYMLEEHAVNRSICNVNFGGIENQGMDSQEEDTDDVTGEFMSHLPHRLDGTNNCSDLMEEQDLQDESCMSYEWNHEAKSNVPICISSTGFHAVQQDNTQKATNFDNCQKEEKQLDTHCGKDASHEDLKANGFLSCKEEYVMDGHSLLEPCDSKLWDIALVTSLQTDVDRLVSTCSMIKELFGDEARENEKLRNNAV